MKNKMLMSPAGVLLGVLGLTACGGGGDSLTSADTTTTTGVITSFGSIFVNGVEFETDGASSSLDGVSGTGQNGLKVGMVVAIKGRVNGDGTGTATHITYADEVEGLVLANNLAADGTGTLNVMGQTVTLDAATVFESHVAGVTSPTQIAVGNIVEVSGYSSGNGGIYATRVEVKSVSMEQYRLQYQEQIEVKGLIANLNTATQTFTLGTGSTLVIEYGGATLDLSGQALREGLYVEVKSTAGIDQASGHLVASEVELEGDGDKGIDGAAGDHVEFRGMVTSVNSATEFELNGQPVRFTQQTRFENGSAQEIAEQVMVKVEGELDASGVIIANEIQFEERARIEIQAELDSADAAANTITVLGKTIHINNSTLIEDHVDGLMQMSQFMQSLRAGYRVEVHAYVDAEGNLVATKLEREYDGETTGVDLEGPVDEVPAAGILVIAGITVDTGTNFPTFVARPGDELEIEGSFNGSILVATSVSRSE